MINLQTPNNAQLHLEVLQISMDLIGPFEMTPIGNQYAMTVICMLTNYVMCIPLAGKSAATVVRTYLKDIYYRFRDTEKSDLIMGMNSTIWHLRSHHSIRD